MSLGIYRWNGTWLRRARFLDANGNPGWALAQECCCTGCCNAPSSFSGLLSVAPGCDVTWNINPIELAMGVDGYWHGANESSGDFSTTHIDWEAWCDCDEGTYYLQMSGTLADGYNTPFACGPVAATYVNCDPEEFEIRFTITCEGCTFQLVMTPTVGASWTVYCK